MANIETGEILDEIITRSRGEIRHIHSPKTTSSTPTSQEKLRHTSSPGLSQRVHSPRFTEMRKGKSPGMSPEGVEITEIPSIQPSPLGRNSHASSSS
ncbi:putative boron transporter 2 [Bienertia sinuspersici]